MMHAIGAHMCMYFKAYLRISCVEWCYVQYLRMNDLDRTDLRLLYALQENAQSTAAELAELLHLSASQIGRRRQRLEAEGYITGTTTRVDGRKLGLSVQAFVQVQTGSHKVETHSAFLKLVNYQPEIMAAWTMTGEADYMLRVICADLAALNRLIQDVLLPHPSVGRVQSQIVMEELKDSMVLPLEV